MGSIFSVMLVAAQDNPEMVKDVLLKVFQIFQVTLAIASAASQSYGTSAPLPAPFPSKFSPDEIERKRRHAQDQLGINTVTDYNIAFCGQLKAGKSRMINAVRSVRRGEAGWAQTDNIKCTVEITPYRFPDNRLPHLVLWDFPGAGQIDSPVQSYFEEKMLYAFDCLLLFLGDTVREEDITFAREAIRHNLPFAFVRSKCDIVLSERMESMVKESATLINNAKKQFLTECRGHFRKELQHGGSPIADTKLFFVSSPVFEQSTELDLERYRLEEDGLMTFVMEKSLSRRGILGDTVGW